MLKIWQKPIEEETSILKKRLDDQYTFPPILGTLKKYWKSISLITFLPILRHLFLFLENVNYQEPYFNIFLFQLQFVYRLCVEDKILSKLGGNGSNFSNRFTGLRSSMLLCCIVCYAMRSYFILYSFDWREPHDCTPTMFSILFFSALSFSFSFLSLISAQLIPNLGQQLSFKYSVKIISALSVIGALVGHRSYGFPSSTLKTTYTA